MSVRCESAILEGESRKRGDIMLLDHFLPRYDHVEIQRIVVAAPPDVVYAAIRTTNLRDPVIDLLSAIRELPNRVVRRMRGTPEPLAPSSITFETLATPEMGFQLLAEEPGIEMVVGAVGRFWKRDYGWHDVAPEAFTDFAEPGFAKLALSLRVQSLGEDMSLLCYEVRTATTNEEARKRFRRYWRVIHHGAAIVMHRALVRIRFQAERKHAMAPTGAR